MITSGLVLTLTSDATLAAEAIAKVSARDEFTPGDRNDRWLPIAMEARDDAASRDLHDWLHALPGVEFVDVVYVNFEEPERGGVEDQPLVEDDSMRLACSAGVSACEFAGRYRPAVVISSRGGTPPELAGVTPALPGNAKQKLFR